MSAVNSKLRETFKGIADILIPNAEGMPAASEVGVHEDSLDMIIGLRPDLKDDFVRGLVNVAGKDPREAANTLNMEDAEALTAIGLVASAAYYMSPLVREKIGYPGQQSRPDPDPDATPEYVSNGMLQQVIDRGPIFRSTIK